MSLNLRLKLIQILRLKISKYNAVEIAKFEKGK